MLAHAYMMCHVSSLNLDYEMEKKWQYVQAAVMINASFESKPPPLLFQKFASTIHAM